MKVLDVEIEFDFYDADNMEKFEKYSEEAQKELDNIDNININKLKQSEFIRKTCNIIYRCFDNIFGEGISEKIFKNKNNFKSCVKAFKDLIEARVQQDSEIEEEMEAFKKYTPNRVTRGKRK